jgi:hypothetical protein
VKKIWLKLICGNEENVEITSHDKGILGGEMVPENLLI